MARKRTSTILATATTLVLVTACGGGGGDGDGDTTPAASGDGGSTSTSEPADSGVSAEDFDADLVAAAQEEGEVVIYAGGHTRPGLELIEAEFEEVFGIPVTSVREDSGGVVQSIEAELESGSLNADVVSLTDAPTMFRWADEGTTTGVDLPNADDLLDGFYDDATPQVPYSVVSMGIMYNDSASEAPTSWADFATGEEGAIVASDPSASGTALMFFHLMEQIIGEGWMDDLATREVAVTESSLTLSQLVVTGEADFGLPAIESAVIGAAQEGEPLVTAFPEEGVPAFASELAALADASNPAAAELLVQFHLNADVQQALTELGARSILADAPQPDGGADLSDIELVTPDYAALEGDAEEIRARFDELLR
jgi:iron(III) transport system substrate-binding protein